MNSLNICISFVFKHSKFCTAIFNILILMHIEAVFPFKIQIGVHTSLTLLMWQKASNCFCREHKSS